MIKTYAETLLTEKNITPRQACLTVSKDVAHTPGEGIGLNITLDAQAKNCYPAMDDEGGWHCLLENLSWLSPSWICVTLPANELMDKNGEIIETAIVLKRFDRFCKWADENKVNINLMFPKAVPFGMRFKSTNGHSMAPADLELYSKVIAKVMDYLVHGKGYGRIKYMTIFGEPFNEDGGDFSFGTPNGIDPYAYYVDFHRIVRQALDSYRLFDLGLMGPNSADVFAYLETMRRFSERGLDLCPHLAAIDMHSYRMRFDYLPPSHQVPTCTLNEYINDYLRPAVEYAKAKGKPFFITELGCMYYGKSSYGYNYGPSRHEAFIAEAELIIRALNLGVDGFLKWAYLFDTSGSSGHYQLLDFIDGTYRRKGSFYGYGALCRYFPKGANVSRITVKETSGASLHAAVIKSADSAVTTIMLVNDHPSDMLDVHIDGLVGDKAFRKLTIDTWHQSAETVECRQADGGTMTARSLPLSLTVLTNAI